MDGTLFFTAHPAIFDVAWSDKITAHNIWNV